MPPSPQPIGPILPAPKRVRCRAGHFLLRPQGVIALSPNQAEGVGDSDYAAAVALRRAIRDRWGLSLCIESHARSEDLGPCIALRSGSASGAEGEAYSVRVGPQRVELDGAGPAGLRYAVESTLQLIRPMKRGPRLPGCEIEDSPDFALRGVMLDISRGKVPSFETLCELVDRCVRLKLNTLMLYTEHTFRFRRHPKIGADASPLKAETLRALDRYAAENFVDLVPCLQSLGHMEHILKLPEYTHLAESERGWTIAPVEPDSYALLRDLYDEYLPNFRSRYFNANCDEPWDLGKGKSAERSGALGPGAVYLEHIDRISELAAARGKRTMIWGDVVHAHPEHIPKIHRDAILLDWWYEADCDFDRVRVFAENGIDFVVCPGTSSWNCLFPRIENSCLNTARWAQAARRHGALGLVTTDWGDGGHYNLLGNSWFGYAFAAQQSWSGNCDPKVFERAFSHALFHDASAEPGAIYRALGAVHDPGFSMFNGSAIQYLFFDDLELSYFISACQPGKLTRCERSLVGIRRRLERARERFRHDLLTFEELSYAADASLFSVHKAHAGLAYNAWRRDPAQLGRAETRKLARGLRRLADEQIALGRRLRRLWLARSEPSNLEQTLQRLRRSVASLRRAATALEKRRPGKPPPRQELTPQGTRDALRRSFGD